MYLIITSDDLCPDNMHLWGNWTKLKKEHPRLKVTFFVPAMFQKNSRNDVIKNKEFKQWYKDNKDWVEVAAHGLYHKLPPEFTKFEHIQEKIIKKMTIKLRKYMPKQKGFKAPFYRCNEVTFKLIKEAGYSYFAHWNTIFFLKPIIPNAPPFMLINTHTNASDKKKKGKYFNSDNINLIYKSLNRKLKIYEKRGITYLRVSDYINKYHE